MGRFDRASVRVWRIRSPTNLHKGERRASATRDRAIRQVSLVNAAVQLIVAELRNEANFVVSFRLVLLLFLNL
jgi:hypothetical protein